MFVVSFLKKYFGDTLGEHLTTSRLSCNLSFIFVHQITCKTFKYINQSDMYSVLISRFITDSLVENLIPDIPRK